MDVCAVDDEGAVIVSPPDGVPCGAAIERGRGTCDTAGFRTRRARHTGSDVPRTRRGACALRSPPSLGECVDLDGLRAVGVVVPADVDTQHDASEAGERSRGLVIESRPW